MTNWRKIIETNPVFHLIIKKTIDEHPAIDLLIKVEIHKKDAKVSIRPGHDWYFDYVKPLRKDPIITWKYRLMRRSGTTCIYCPKVEWTIEASVLCKIFVNTAFEKESNQIIMETWK